MQENYHTFGNRRPAANDQDGHNNEIAQVPSPYFVYRLACFAGTGGLLFGYNAAIMTGTLPGVEAYFRLSTFWAGLTASGAIGGAAFFALLAGYACDKFGRKAVIMFSSVVFIVGAGLSGAALNKEMLLVGRIVVGIGMGFASMTVPVYVAETSPPAIRGRLVTLTQLFMTTGILISGIAAGAFSKIGNDFWRYMYLLPMVPASIQFIGFLFLPESPRWLVSNGNVVQARRVLQRINGVANVEIELRDIERSVDAQETKTDPIIVRVLCTPHVRKAMFVGVSLNIFTSLSGINSVIYDSVTILEMAGFSPKNALWLQCVPCAFSVVATVIAVILVEKVGRKKLLVFSLMGVFLAGTILATGFQLSNKLSPDIDPNITEKSDQGVPLQDGCYNGGFRSCASCVERDYCGFCYKGQGELGSCLRVDPDDPDAGAQFGRCKRSAMTSLSTKWSHQYCPTEYNFIAVLGMAWFMLCFAPGLGPMTWTITSEIYPLWARSTCYAVGTGVNWICYLLVIVSFLTFFRGISYGAYWLFAGICLIGLFVTYAFVPETKNTSLEDAELLFGAPEPPGENPGHDQAQGIGYPDPRKVVGGPKPKDVIDGPDFLRRSPRSSRSSSVSSFF